MAKQALLIGSQTGTLTGVHRDVEAAAERLIDWGFATETCTGGDATRAGILQRYQALIDRTQANDSVVVYYSGHGGLAANPDFEPMAADGVIVPRYYQFIVPSDIQDTTENDFRGIMSLELSALLAQLTAKTKNATVILDCCHSARMSRDLDLVPRALPEKWFLGVEAHLAKLTKGGLLGDVGDVESNPDAVRLVACGPRQSAYEYTNRAGVRMGLLTESLLVALEDAKEAKVSWRSLGTRIRQRALSVVPYQRPEIEGPSDRVLFELDTVELTGILPVITHRGFPVLQGGRLLGINVGDQYLVAPAGVEKATTENAIARATVVLVTGSYSMIQIDYLGAHTDIPEGANAFPQSSTLPRRAVRVSATGTQGQALRDRIDDSRFVRVATEEDDPAEVMAEVAVDGGQIDLRDRAGLRMIEPKRFDDLEVGVTVSNLDRFARAQALRELPSGEGPNTLKTPYEVEWGRVMNGRPQPLDQTGETLHVGDPVYVRVTNRGSEKIYFSLFDIGLSSKITLLTTSEPSGIELEGDGDAYVFGAREPLGLTGIKLGWAEGVPKENPQYESLAVIVSDRPQDLRSLEARGMRDAFADAAPQSPLQQVMGQIAQGGTRDLGSETEVEADIRYAITRIDFLVNPNPRTA